MIKSLCISNLKHFCVVKQSCRKFQNFSLVKSKLCNRQCISDLPRRFKKTDKSNVSSFFVPVPVKTSPDDINVGVELSGRLKKQDLLRVLTKFYQKPEIRLLCAESGLDDNLQHQAFISFRRYCIENDLPPDLHVILSDILQGSFILYLH
jgi:hypothetical protein